MPLQQTSPNAETDERPGLRYKKILRGRTGKTTKDLTMKIIQLGEVWRIFASRNRDVNHLYVYYVFRKGSVHIRQTRTIFGGFSSVTSPLWEGLLINWNEEWKKNIVSRRPLLSLITFQDFHASCFKSIALGPNLPRGRTVREYKSNSFRINDSLLLPTWCTTSLF